MTLVVAVLLVTIWDPRYECQLPPCAAGPPPADITAT